MNTEEFNLCTFLQMHAHTPFFSGDNLEREEVHTSHFNFGDSITPLAGEQGVTIFSNSHAWDSVDGGAESA